MQTPSWSPQQQDSFLDLRDYLSVLRRRKRLILIITVAFVALAIGYTSTQTKIYTATAKVLIRPPISTASSTTSNFAPQINKDNEIELITSTAVAEAALKQILEVNPEATVTGILRKLEVTSPGDADVLQVKFADPRPELARVGAESFAESYLSFKTSTAQAQLDAQAAGYRDAIAVLRAKSDSTIVGSGIDLLTSRLLEIETTTIDPGTVILEASTPKSPTSPNLPMNIALALFLGLFLGVIAAYFRERMDDHLRGRHDLEDTIGAPVMTMIPSVPGWRDRNETQLVTILAPRSPAAEAYRTLRTSILVAAAERGIKTLMVVSALAGEGKSTTAGNLSVVLAQAGKRVVLISADLRRPRIHEFFGIEGGRGLAEVLAGERRPWESLKSGRIDNLWVMSSGRIPENPTELLQSNEMQELMSEQREVVDFMVIDCPPVLAVADAMVLAPLVDGVIFVADAAGTPRDAVIQARAQLDQVGARMLGAVLNNVDSGTTGYAYYGSQYGYGPTGNGQPAANGKATVWETIRKDRS